MFRKLKPNVIAGATFEVELTRAATELRYRESGNAYTMDIEPMAGPVDFALYAASLRKAGEPLGASSLGPARRQAILQNIIDALRYDGCEVEVFP